MTHLTLGTEKLIKAEITKKYEQVGILISKAVTAILGGMVFVLPIACFLTDQQYTQNIQTEFHLSR